MKYLKIVLLTIYSLNVMAQESDLQVALIETRLRSQRVEFDHHKKEVKGSLFLWDDWKNGDVELKGGEIIKDVLINYDIDKKEILLNEDAKYYYLSIDQITGFDKMIKDPVSKTEERRFSKVLVKDKSEIMEVLVLGEYPLYKHVEIKIIKPTYNKVLDIGDRTTKIKKKSVFYIKDDGKLIKLPTKQKKARKAFSDSKPILSYLKENKIDLKDEEEVVKMMNYINRN